MVESRIYDKSGLPVLDSDGGRITDLLQLVDALRGQKRGGVVGSADGYPLFAHLEESISVIGSPRVGKTSAFFVPSVATHPGCVIATSIRTDLRDHTIAARRAIVEKYGGSVFELDFTGSLATMSERVYWDATEHADNWNVAWQRAQVMTRVAVRDTQSSHWISSASKTLAVLLYAAALRGETVHDVARTLESIPEVVTDDEGNVLTDDAGNELIESAFVEYEETLLEVAQQRFEIDGGNDSGFRTPNGYLPSAKGYEAFLSGFGDDNTAPEERASILSTSSNVLNCMRSDLELGAALNLHGVTTLHSEWTENWDIVKFLTTPSTMYITVPSERAEELRPLVSAFVDWITTVWRQLPRDGRAVGLFLALDEAANISPLPDLPKLVTAGGGDGIQTAVGLHSPRLLENIWAEQAHAIYGEASHVLVFPMRDARFAAEVADLTPRIIQYDLHVTVDPTAIEDLQCAPPDQLRTERLRIEQAKQLARSPFEQRIAVLRELTDIHVERGLGNFRIRPKYQVNAKSPQEAIYAELLDLTRIDQKPSRRTKVEITEVCNPPEGHVYGIAGATSHLMPLQPFFQSSYWRDLMGMRKSAEHGVSREVVRN